MHRADISANKFNCTSSLEIDFAFVHRQSLDQNSPSVIRFSVEIKKFSIEFAGRPSKEILIKILPWRVRHILLSRSHEVEPFTGCTYVPPKMLQNRIWPEPASKLRLVCVPRLRQNAITFFNSKHVIVNIYVKSNILLF